jgi:hypothetical protein
VNATPRRRLLVDGEWVDVIEPTQYERRQYADGIAWMNQNRRAEIAAWLEDVRRENSTLSLNDRRFLRSLRIAADEAETAIE